nr:homoserine O-acetyltransferase [Bacillus sp. 165]
MVRKQDFFLESYTLECGVSIPVKVGYETYGTLNKEKSNVILVCHHFSATSHAAGKYTDSDMNPGWWDALIGPGKAVDTNRYFVICMDNLCNVQVKNSMVVTTGPISINPKTGKQYGMSFPPFTFHDMAGIQHACIQLLGIHHLTAVIGPSAGGMIALHWAVQYPDKLDACIGVITNAQNPVMTSFNVLQHGIRAIQLDPYWKNGQYYGEQEPVEGLHLASQMMFTNAFHCDWYESEFPRNSQDRRPYLHVSNQTSFEKNMYNTVMDNIVYYDANHWIYTCRATMMHDIAHGHSSLEEALQKIQANVLLISCNQDILQPPQYSEQTIRILQKQGKKAEFFAFDSLNGHMAGIVDVPLFENKVRDWLGRI